MAAPLKKNESRVKKPGHLDFKKADEVVTKLIEQNTEWLKEMAKK